MAKHASFKYVRHTRLDTNWSIVIFTISFPFFKNWGYVSLLACFRTDGNSELVTDVLKLVCKKLAKMSASSLMILEGKLVSWHALETSGFKTSLNIFSLATFENEKAACFFFLSLHTSPIVSMLGCFLYFTISLIMGSLILSEIGSLVIYSGILRLSQYLKKRYSKLELCFHHLKQFHFLLLRLFFLWTLFCLKEKV